MSWSYLKAPNLSICYLRVFCFKRNKWGKGDLSVRHFCVDNTLIQNSYLRDICMTHAQIDWRGKTYVNKYNNGYTMQKDGSNFQNLWMTTARNLSVEICHKKLKVNFSYCFRHSIFHNQVYNFSFVLFPGWFHTAIVSQDLFLFFLSISCHSNICEKFNFCFTDFRKTITCLRVTHTAQISTDFLYLRKFTWEKSIVERKVHNPVSQCICYQYYSILYSIQQYTDWRCIHPPKMCMKCYLLMKTASREIAPFRLKRTKKLCPYDNHSCSMCVKITKWNKGALGKINNTSNNDRRGRPFLSKFVE